MRSRKKFWAPGAAGGALVTVGESRRLSMMFVCCAWTVDKLPALSSEGGPTRGRRLKSGIPAVGPRGQAAS
jgi:hypothetical protein